MQARMLAWADVFNIAKPFLPAEAFVGSLGLLFDSCGEPWSLYQSKEPSAPGPSNFLITPLVSTDYGT